MKRLLLAAWLAAVAFGQAVPSYKTLKYPPLPQVKIPEPAEFTLSNGMRVLLLEDHELPLIRGLALIRTGNLLDPSDKRGLSQVMADVLRSGGTKAKTGDQIDEELENIAGSVEAGMDEGVADHVAATEGVRLAGAGRDHQRAHQPPEVQLPLALDDAALLAEPVDFLLGP